jgi:hypothetical protein
VKRNPVVVYLFNAPVALAALRELNRRSPLTHSSKFHSQPWKASFRQLSLKVSNKTSPHPNTMAGRDLREVLG